MSEFITEAELKAEYKRLDLLRESETARLTDEQFKLIDYARTNGKPITFEKILKYWNDRGWKKISLATLRNWYEKEKEKREM